ncbi:MAG TPA: SRPBCC family protein [Magnetospirillaceae bacterium]|jgi:carbon monoxide dehydrogenase subunit G
MATIRKEIDLGVGVDAVWDAVRDFVHVDKRLAPGFVVESLADPDTANGVARLVTFFNGLKAREPLVSCNDATRRLVYGATGGRASHYNASVEVIDAGSGRSRLIWTIDILPEALAGPIGQMVEHAAEIMKKTLEG